MYTDTQTFLEAAGFSQYEISNYARPGYECRHNLTYWYRGDYLGLGLGAASLVDERRFSVTRDLKAYLAGLASDPHACKDKDSRPGLIPVADYPLLSVQEQMEETMFLGLRCSAGVEKEAFAARFGKEMDAVYGDVIRRYASLGFLEDTGRRIRLTREGISVSNYVMADFLLS